MAKKKVKPCTNPPIEFSQKAIDLLYPLFPDSEGNLDADDVMTALWSHFGQGDTICFPTKGGNEYNEIYDAVEALLKTGKTAFSPVLPEKPKVYTTPFLFFSEFAETQETHDMSFHEFLKDKWLGQDAQIEEIIPCGINAKGKVKFKVTYYKG